MNSIIDDEIKCVRTKGIKILDKEKKEHHTTFQNATVYINSQP